MNLLTEQVRRTLWTKINYEWFFGPKWDVPFEWIVLPEPHTRFSLISSWNREQEKLVNSFFEELGQEDIYALDWQHDCFEFSPQERTDLENHYPADEQETEVQLPSYFPDGEFHFFIDKNMKYGMFGNPKRKEIVVLGKELIDLFENNARRLYISEKAG